jgi:O-antigen/teichoic acid export membrane protein
MALVYAHLLSLALICLLCIRLLNRHFSLRLMLEGPLRDETFYETLKAGLGVLPVNIVSRLFVDGPALALNAILPGSQGAIAASLFIIARKISSIVQLVRTAFAHVLAPLASAASAEGKDQVASIYGFATRLSLALALPLGAVLVGMGPVMLKGFGPGADAALTALIIMTVARVTEAIFGAATPIQQATSAHLDQQLGSLVGITVASLIAWLALPVYGLDAMAVAVAMGLVIAAILPLFQLHIIDKLHPFAAPFGTVFARACLVSVSGIIAVHLVPLLVQAGPEVSGVLSMPRYMVTFALQVPIALAALWMSLRFALTTEDRAALGVGVIRRLKLG